MERIIRRRPPVEKGEHLYRAGDRFDAIYAVRTGSVKTFSPTRDGHEQITGFHLSGELLGLDAINSGVHVCTARVLETTAICEIPFDDLEEICDVIPDLHRRLLKVMSKELLYEQSLLAVIGKRNSVERLAAFLLSVAERFNNRGFSSTEFLLSMSRDDIGNYLGIAMETVSRMFARLQDYGVLEVDGRYVRIVDKKSLRRFANQAELARIA